MHVENRLVSYSPPGIIGIPVFTKKHIVASRRFSVLQTPFQKINFFILLTHENVPELMAENQCSHSSNGICKQGMWSVKGVDIT